MQRYSLVYAILIFNASFFFLKHGNATFKLREDARENLIILCIV